MQDDSGSVRPPVRPNRERTQATQAALLAAARALFVRKGYADTGTPEIVAAAQVTRGALYHHFADKAALFLAVARQAADEVAHEIERGSTAARTPLQALIDGAEAYFAAMAQAGRARLLLLDAPAVLDAAQLLELSERAGARALEAGVRAAWPAGRPLDAATGRALTDLLSAAFDRAALAQARGEPAGAHRRAIELLLARLVGRDEAPTRPSPKRRINSKMAQHPASTKRNQL